MKVVPFARAAVAAAMLPMLVSGCVVPKAQLDAVQAQSRVLREQNRTQLAEIENLRSHSHQTEDQLATAEGRVASLEEQLGLERSQLSNFERERHQLHEQVRGLAQGQLPVSPEVGRRLAEISRRFPSLHFDPRTGVSKLDVDIMFDTGKAELKPAAQQVLAELVQLLKIPEAHDLKVLVVGHTDDRPIARKPARELYGSNFDLSTARASTVADQLRRLGLEDQRLGVAGFGSHQPIAPNISMQDRQKNRRVEIFVMAPEVPVVGWIDSTPTVY